MRIELRLLLPVWLSSAIRSIQGWWLYLRMRYGWPGLIAIGLIVLLVVL